MTDTAVATRDRDEEIALVAMRIYQTGFVSARLDSYQPRQGTLMRKLWSERKLTAVQQKSWFYFTRDLRDAHGKSGPLVSNYGESVGSNNPSEFRAPSAFENVQFKRIERLFIEHLNMGERVLLRDLMSDEIQCQGLLILERIGLHKNGYASKDQARASGVTRITCLLDRLVSYYGVG